MLENAVDTFEGLSGMAGVSGEDGKRVRLAGAGRRGVIFALQSVISCET